MDEKHWPRHLGRQLAICLSVALLVPCYALAQDTNWAPGSVFEMAAAQPIAPISPVQPLPPVQPVLLTQPVQPMQPAPEPTLVPRRPAPPQQMLPVADERTAPAADQKYGEQPPDRSHEFLRKQDVLLRPGQWQFDVGLQYLIFTHDYTQLGQSGNLISAIDSRLTRRLLVAPLDVRYGISDRLQAFADVPFGWSNTENSYPGFDDFVNQGGIGDITAGLNWLVHKSCGCSCDPDVIATFSLTAPAANVSPLQGILEPPNTMLGTGFFYGSWNVLFIHTVDPVILFYGFGSRHGLSREFEGFDIHPGDQYYYRAGMGFAVNEKITLSSSLTGWYITDPYLDNVRIAGLAMEPITLRFAATIARPCERYIEPFVELGMTPDAPDARVGLTFTF
jgi:hypothetical protein